VGGQGSHRRSLEELHAKADFRMDRIRSICKLGFFFLETQKEHRFDFTNRQSTVMLAGNVGFLAIQGVIVVPQPPEKGWIIPSPAQIASSMSLVFSLGSIITGLLLIRRNRTMAIQDPGTIVRWSFHILHFLADRLLVGIPG
jgi:hypothetical protein